MRMNPAQAARDAASGGAFRRASGVAEVRLYLPASDEITRNSLNDATDDDELTLTTVVVPPNNGAVRGTEFQVVTLWENTNSASQKNGYIRINGASWQQPMQNTTNQGAGSRLSLQVVDANTLRNLGRGDTFGTGTTAGAGQAVTIAGLAASGFTLQFNSKWTAQPISGEFIRLVYARVIQINP